MKLFWEYLADSSLANERREEDSRLFIYFWLTSWRTTVSLFGFNRPQRDKAYMWAWADKVQWFDYTIEDRQRLAQPVHILNTPLFTTVLLIKW